MSNAFLNAELSEDVVILTQPAPGLIQFGLVESGAVYQCTKACYGLREAPKVWEEAKDKTLTSFVFQIGVEEHNLRQSTYNQSFFGLLFTHLALCVSELFDLKTTVTYQTYQFWVSTSI